MAVGRSEGLKKVSVANVTLAVCHFDFVALFAECFSAFFDEADALQPRIASRHSAAEAVRVPVPAHRGEKSTTKIPPILIIL